jgi:hypothetical protein
MDRHLEDLARSRTRNNKPVSKAHLIREAIRLYLDQQADLYGSRKQIAKSIEGKLEALTFEVTNMGDYLERLHVGIQEQNNLIHRIGQGIPNIINFLKGNR